MIKDMYDIEIEIGDTIAAPFSYGDTPTLRIGQVTEIVPASDPSKYDRIRVQWLKGKGLPDKPTLVQVGNTYGGGSRVLITEKV